MKIAYITRIKDEESLISYNLIYYYMIGVRDFFVCFNNSNDETIQKVESFMNSRDVNYFPYKELNTEYNQAEMFNIMSGDAHSQGYHWQVPTDADELLFLKNTSLENVIKKYDKHEYGYINFRWVDYHPSHLDDNTDPCFFTRWKYREPEPRQPSKIIVKWTPGMKFGDGHHLVISKRKKIAEVPIDRGFFAHFVNREKEQIKKKRIRIGEAFIQKYGYESQKPQIKEYKAWEREGDAYFDRVWENLRRTRRKNFDNYVYDPLPEHLFVDK